MSAFLTIQRAGRMSLDSFRRNLWLSAVTILILTVSLLLFSLVLGVNVVTSKLTSSLQSRVDLTATYKPGAPAATVSDLERRVRGVDGVRTVTHISAEENLKTFTERHKDDPDIAATLKLFTKNPLGASSVVTAADSKAYERALAVVNETAYTSVIDATKNSLTANAETIRRFGEITSKVKTLGLGVTGLFLLIAVLVIFNTLRITIYTHREEISIMRLVGASNGFIRAPFVLESLLYAFIATVVAFLVIIPLIQSAAPFLNRLLLDYDTNLVSYFNGHLLETFFLELAVAVALSGFSALVAVGRYIRI
jgi:cell division transport system permease protein